MSDKPQELTPAQICDLAAFADNLRTGRRIACGVAHMFVALGAIASALAGVIAGVNAWHGQ